MMFDIDTILDAYIECALWSSTVGEEGTPMDDDYGISDLADETRETMRQECSDFLDLCREEIGSDEDIYRRMMEGTSSAATVMNFGSDEMFGHDFWLTRNGHGVGFWDRGYPGTLGDELTKWAESFGTADLYIGDDGKVYQT